MLTNNTVLLNGATRLATLPLTGLAGLWTAHLILKAVGPLGLGVVTLITTLPALLPFLDLGIGAAVASTMADRSDQLINRDRIVGVGVFLLALAGLALMVIVTVCTAAGLSWSQLLGIPRATVPNLQTDILLLAILLGASLAPSLGYRVLLGLDAYWLAQLIQLLMPALTLSLTAAASWHGSVDAIILAPFCSQFLAAVVSVPVALRRGQLRAARIIRCIRPGDLETRKRLLQTAVPMVVVSVGLPIAFQTDRLVLSHRSSEQALAMYASVALLYAPLLSIMTNAGFSLWPRFVALRAKGHPRLEYTNSLKCFALLGLTGGVILAFVGPVITRMWAGQNLATEIVWASGACLLLTQTSHLPAGMFLMDPLGLRIQALCVAAMVMLNLGLSIAWARTLGAAGPLLASATSVAICQLIPGILYIRSKRE